MWTLAPSVCDRETHLLWVPCFLDWKSNISMFAPLSDYFCAHQHQIVPHSSYAWARNLFRILFSFSSQNGHKAWQKGTEMKPIYAEADIRLCYQVCAVLHFLTMSSNNVTQVKAYIRLFRLCLQKIVLKRHVMIPGLILKAGLCVRILKAVVVIFG